MRGEPIIVKQLLTKAKDSAMLAIEFYNKPAVNFKSEGFITMMCIAWTGLFHAYFFKNKIKPYYRKNENSKRSRYKTITIEIADGEKIKENKWKRPVQAMHIIVINPSDLKFTAGLL